MCLNMRVLLEGMFLSENSKSHMGRFEKLNSSTSSAGSHGNSMPGHLTCRMQLLCSTVFPDTHSSFLHGSMSCT